MQIDNAGIVQAIVEISAGEPMLAAEVVIDAPDVLVIGLRRCRNIVEQPIRLVRQRYRLEDLLRHGIELRCGYEVPGDRLFGDGVQ